MVNSQHFDSDLDYRLATMSAVQRRIEALEEGEQDALESFASYLEARGLLLDIVHEWAAGHRRYLHEWADAVAWADEVEAGEEKAERLGLM